MSKLRILLADDHEVVRYGLSGLLESNDDLNVVAEASTGHQAVEQYKEHQPDVGVLDISMPGLNGIDTARQIKEFDPDANILMLTMHTSEEYLDDVLRAGITGYILKNSGHDEIINAIRDVSNGKRVFSDQISQFLAQRYVSTATGSTNSTPTLTPREKEVLSLIAEGYTSAQIAQSLYISPRTVEKHRSNMMNKINARNSADLVRFAITEEF